MRSLDDSTLWRISAFEREQAREVESGNIHVNWSSQWRADLMPYGGIKASGLGKEGPQYAIREMTEEKMVVLHLK